MSYSPEPALLGLFHAFTGEAGSIGSALTRLMVEQSLDAPLLVSSASDIALFPGGGAAPRVESFRKSTRGFIELTAISHLPLALCYLARMRQRLPDPAQVARLAEMLRGHAQRARATNTESMWRDKVALRTFQGLEPQIKAMVDYTLDTSIAYLARAEHEPHLLDFEALREQYLDPHSSLLPVSMNSIMFATFCLAYIDIAYRIGNWLREQDIDWPRAMVLVSGQSGRPTAGVTWGSNNMCGLIWKASDGTLPAEQLYVAPHAPGFSAASEQSTLAGQEAEYRRLWCHTRASVEVSRQAFAGFDAYAFQPDASGDMPPLPRDDAYRACMARLRRIMEDPQQLLSNCVADYVVDELRHVGNRPELVHVPGFTQVDFRLLTPSRTAG